MTERSIFLAALEIDDPAARAAYLDERLPARPGPPRGGSRSCSPPTPRPAASWPGRPPDRDPLDPTAGSRPTPRRPRPAGARRDPPRRAVRAGPGDRRAAGWGRSTGPSRSSRSSGRWPSSWSSPGWTRGTVLARFEAERQALALMDHPNIAKVLDAGATPDGRPFFVMELVERRPPHRLLRRPPAARRRPARPVPAGLPGGAARPPEGGHPPRPQALQRPGRGPRREAGAEGHRLRAGEGRRRDRPDRPDPVHRPRGRSPGTPLVHGPGAGRAGRRRTWTPGPTCTPSG